LCCSWPPSSLFSFFLLIPIMLSHFWITLERFYLVGINVLRGLGAVFFHQWPLELSSSLRSYDPLVSQGCGLFIQQHEWFPNCPQELHAPISVPHFPDFMFLPMLSPPCGMLCPGPAVDAWLPSSAGQFPGLWAPLHMLCTSCVAPVIFYCVDWLFSLLSSYNRTESLSGLSL
jgi:hypothetical protein